MEILHKVASHLPSKSVIMAIEWITANIATGVTLFIVNATSDPVTWGATILGILALAYYNWHRAKAARAETRLKDAQRQQIEKELKLKP